MYEIGQKVVCVKTHIEANVKEGEIKTIEGMRIDCEGDLVLNIGIETKDNSWSDGVNVPTGDTYKCRSCKQYHTHDGIWWLAANRFRPLDDLYNTEIEELMNEVNERVPFEL